MYSVTSQFLLFSSQSPFPGERFDLQSFPGTEHKEGQQMPLLCSWENITDSHSCVSEIRTCSFKLEPEFSSHCTAQSPQPCSCSGSFSKGSAHSCRSLQSLQRIPPLCRDISMELNRNQSCGSLSAQDLFLKLSRGDRGLQGAFSSDVTGRKNVAMNGPAFCERGP